MRGIEIVGGGADCKSTGFGGVECLDRGAVSGERGVEFWDTPLDNSFGRTGVGGLGIAGVAIFVRGES